MKKLSILIFSVSFLLSSCYKENKLAEKLAGTWKIEESQWANGSDVDLSADQHKIEFFDCEMAYTATCRGVYHLDYSDTLKTDLLDTFQFDIKKDELAVTSVKTTLSSNQFVIRFLRQRFSIEDLGDNNLYLKRIRTFKDSTDGFLKATKL
ncbi:MAG: hypothetical protein KDC13_00355 [Bacteroidetes bacterium]|nr:hypothetical protein [Bacteroidota bacterium]